jgi:hypothetical protein
MLVKVGGERQAAGSPLLASGLGFNQCWWLCRECGSRRGCPSGGHHIGLGCVTCSRLYGDSHLLEQKQEMGQNATWKMIHFAQLFIEHLLVVNTWLTVEKKNMNFLMVLRSVTTKLKSLHES